MGSKSLRYMLDTCICVYVTKKRSGVVEEWMKHDSGELCISAITYAELYYGIEGSDRREESIAKLNELLEGITILDFGKEAAVEYGRIRQFLRRQGTPIGDRDMMIAAHANSLDLTLVTHNVREFTRVPGLEVVDWT